MAAFPVARWPGPHHQRPLSRQLRLCIAISILCTGIATASSAIAAQIVPLPSSVHLKVVSHAGQYAITAYGTYSKSPSELDVYIQCAPHSCGLSMPKPCAATSTVEGQAVLSEQRTDTAPAILMRTTLNSSNTSYSETGTWGKGAANGIYWVCAYLLASHGSGQQPADPPQARASARLTIGSVPKPSPTSSPFTVVDLRVQLTNKQDNLNQTPLRTVRSGQKFWVWWTVRANRAMKFSLGRWSATLKTNDRTLTQDSFKFPNGFPPVTLARGQEINASSDPLTVHGAVTKLTILGKVTINGATGAKSTWVQVTG